MNDNEFDELCTSIREAGEIKKGLKEPSRTFEYSEPDAKSIRTRLGISQSRFAAIMGVSVRTLQNWEQGRRNPEGPAKALLRIVDRVPDVVLSLFAQDSPMAEQVGSPNEKQRDKPAVS